MNSLQAGASVFSMQALDLGSSRKSWHRGMAPANAMVFPSQKRSITHATTRPGPGTWPWRPGSWAGSSRCTRPSPPRYSRILIFLARVVEGHIALNMALSARLAWSSRARATDFALSSLPATDFALLSLAGGGRRVQEQNRKPGRAMLRSGLWAPTILSASLAKTRFRSV